MGEKNDQTKQKFVHFKGFDEWLIDYYWEEITIYSSYMTWALDFYFEEMGAYILASYTLPEVGYLYWENWELSEWRWD